MEPREAINAIRKGIYSLASKDMHIEARCEALEAAILMIGERLDMPRDELSKRIADAAAVALQSALERAEAHDPAGAALLDSRPTVPDLPDETHEP